MIQKALKNIRKYSRDTQEDWVHTKPKFTKKSLLIKNYQVMQRWEDGYMKSLAAVATSRGGDVLEVGFGMGISAKYIERYKKIKTHTVIECHPEVIASAKKMFGKELASGKMRLLEGFWEDITPNLPDGSFDGILFDSCPLDAPVEFFQFFPFFSEAYRLLRKGGVFTYFSDEPRDISAKHRAELIEAGFQPSDIKFKLCKVHPPKDCEYWHHDTIVTPIIHKA